MSLIAVEHIFDGETTPYTSYDSTKTNLGKWIQQKNLGSHSTDKFAGPFPLTFARPLEQSTSIGCIYPYVIDWSPTISWIFCSENAAASTTRRIALYTFNKSTQDLTWRGFITTTPPSGSNHFVRGLAVGYHTYSTGTVSASGTAVTGSSTAWQTDRFAVGCRIGFGSTDPTAITTWYHVTAITTNTSITLQENAGTIPGSTPFVLEELRVYTSNTASTAANGGLFVAKGVNFDDFTIGGTTIAAATFTDNLKACYWLADAATVLNTVPCGLAIDSTQSNTSHFLWVVNQDAATTSRIYKYDGRVALAGLVSGKSTSAFVFRTGQQGTTGTINAQGHNGIIATAAHGPGSGLKSLYFATTTRIYRADESTLTNGSTTFLTDSMAEVSPGNSDTFTITSGLSTIAYDSVIDRFIVSAGTNAFLSYVTQYANSTSTPFDHYFTIDTRQIDTSGASPNIPASPTYQTSTTSPIAFRSSDGILYGLRGGATVTTLNNLYIWPLSCDWTYAAGSSDANQQRLITPSISTPNCVKYVSVYPSVAKNFGDSIIGLQPEPLRIYYRTSGISDDSGSWTLVAGNGDLSALTPASAIQFMFEFRTIGTTCLMQRVFSIAVSYEDETTDSHFEPSIRHSHVTNKIFAWRIRKTFGGTVPTLAVVIYDDVTDGIIAADRTIDEDFGSFEKSTDDGNTWGTYDDNDKTNEITYIRYTVTGTVNGVKARAMLQQYSNQTLNSGTPAGSLEKDIVFGSNSLGDKPILETDVGTANSLNNILASNNNQDALVHELKQMPVPIANRRKVR